MINAKITNSSEKAENLENVPVPQVENETKPKITVEIIKKTKKNQPKIFPHLMQVDKEAFESCGSSNTKFIMKEFWNSPYNKILIARKSESQAIVGYAIFCISDPKDSRFGKNKRIPSVYLHRIGVRSNCQGQGIGRKLMNFLLEAYPEHLLSLDVSTDNDNAIKFYFRCGLKIREVYLSCPDNVEFALFESPSDKNGKKLNLKECQENWNCLAVQRYFDSITDYKKEFESVQDQEIQIQEQINEQLSNLQETETTIENAEEMIITPRTNKEINDSLDSSAKTTYSDEKMSEQSESSQKLTENILEEIDVVQIPASQQVLPQNLPILQLVQLFSHLEDSKNN